MPILRLLLLALLFWLLYRGVLALLGKARPEVIRRRSSDGGQMVRCAHCGLHIPQQEALERDGHYYCSEEHRNAGPR